MRGSQVGGVGRMTAVCDREDVVGTRRAAVAADAADAAVADDDRGDESPPGSTAQPLRAGWGNDHDPPFAPDGDPVQRTLRILPRGPCRIAPGGLALPRELTATSSLLTRNAPSPIGTTSAARRSTMRVAARSRRRPRP